MDYVSNIVRLERKGQPTQVIIAEYTNHYLSIDDYNNKFVGCVLARFERSTLPEHKGTRTVVLRFLKIITPVKCLIPLYDGYVVPPREGEFYRRRRRSEKPIDLLLPPVWGVNIDKSLTFRSLQLLWDT